MANSLKDASSSEGKLEQNNSETLEAGPPKTVDDYLIDYQKPWWRVSHLMRLNLAIFLITLTSTNNGYDGSMLNGLQSLTIWEDYMSKSIGKPLSGAVLGALSNGTVFGGAFGILFASYISDTLGRKTGVFAGQILLVVGAIIQGAANGYAMFIVGRILLGIGSCVATISSPTLISEVAYPSHRAIATTFYNTCWYFGAIIASWVTYGTRNIQTHYCWRIPSYIQAAIPAFQVVTIFLIPESPRYLMNRGKVDKAREVLMKYHVGNDPAGAELVEFELSEIARSLEMDKIYSQTKYTDFLKTPANRKRLFYCIMTPTMMQLSGNGLVSYYLNLVLNSIGITSTDEKLIINGCLMIYNWVIATAVSFTAYYFKRRQMFLVSLVSMMVCYIIWTALSAVNQQRNFVDKSLGQGVLAMIFLYYFSYDIGMNGLPYLYLTEILTYNLRAKGINIMNFTTQVVLIYNGFVNPIAMDAIEWKYYIVYCCILAVETVIVYFTYIETAGYSLEEVCVAFGEDINDISANQYLGRTESKGIDVSHVENV